MKKQHEQAAYFYASLVIIFAGLVLLSPNFAPRKTLLGMAIGDLGPVIFDTGTAELITGTDISSEIIFTPTTDMTLAAIEPRIQSCDGTCHYEVKIYNMQRVLLRQAAQSSSDITELTGEFATPLELTAGTPYNITQKVSSTGLFDFSFGSSVSVYLTGVGS